MNEKFQGWSRRGEELDQQGSDFYEKILAFLIAYLLMFRKNIEDKDSVSTPKLLIIQGTIVLRNRVVNIQNDLLPTYYGDPTVDPYAELLKVVDYYHQNGLITDSERMSLLAFSYRVATAGYGSAYEEVPEELLSLTEGQGLTEYQDNLKNSLMELGIAAYILGYRSDTPESDPDTNRISPFIDNYVSLFGDLSTYRHQYHLYLLASAYYLLEDREEADKEISDLTGEYAGLFVERIAMTEMIRWYELGANNSMIDAGQARKVWYTAQDELVCPVCAPRHMKVYPIASTYPMIPAHSRCRCYWVRYEKAFGGGIS